MPAAEAASPPGPSEPTAADAVAAPDSDAGAQRVFKKARVKDPDSFAWGFPNDLGKQPFFFVKRKTGPGGFQAKCLCHAKVPGRTGSHMLLCTRELTVRPGDALLANT